MRCDVGGKGSETNETKKIRSSGIHRFFCLFWTKQHRSPLEEPPIDRPTALHTLIVVERWAVCGSRSCKVAVVLRVLKSKKCSRLDVFGWHLDHHQECIGATAEGGKAGKAAQDKIIAEE